MRAFVTILILLFLFSGALKGQKKIVFDKNKTKRFQYLKQRIETDQLNVINELAEIIEQANNKKDLLTLFKANVMLGDINFKNGLFQLAIQRFEQSLELEKVIGIKDGIAVSEKLGVTYLALKNYNSASESFNLCIHKSINDAQILRCKEGLSTVYYNNKAYGLAISLLQELEKKYAETDSSNLPRIQALLAKNAVADNNFKYADQNINNAYTNFRNSSKADYKILRESKAKIFEKQNKDFDKEAFLSTNVRNTVNYPEVQALEQLDLIKVQLEKGDITTAEQNIEKIKHNITQIEDLSVKSEIFKQSSSVFALKGDYEAALTDYKQFEKNRSAILLKKEEEINLRLSVLESQKDVEITERTFSSRKMQGIAEQQRSDVLQYIIYLLALLLLVASLAGFTIWRNLKAKNILNKKLKLQSLSSQMNPHFIFNALNSVNEFIATQDEKKANKYLADFSKLMRSVMEVNQHETIDLADEISLSELYLSLEQHRFRNKFEHELIVDSNLHSSEVQVPPLLLQPFIENAIWHGLRYRETKGKLLVYLKNVNERIEITIKDNGIGRKNSIAQKTKFQKQQESTGMKNTKARMDIVEKLYGNSFKLLISDAYSDIKYPGTLVTITFKKN